MKILVMVHEQVSENNIYNIGFVSRILKDLQSSTVKANNAIGK